MVIAALSICLTTLLHGQGWCEAVHSWQCSAMQLQAKQQQNVCPQASTYIQVLRISRIEEGIPRSYLQT